MKWQIKRKTSTAKNYANFDSQVFMKCKLKRKF